MTTRKSFIDDDKVNAVKCDARSSFGKNVFLIAMLLIIIAMLYMAISGNGPAGEIEPIIAKNIFLDVDGGGALDFVTYIEYVPNNPSSIVFPDGQ